MVCSKSWDAAMEKERPHFNWELRKNALSKYHCALDSYYFSLHEIIFLQFYLFSIFK